MKSGVFGLVNNTHPAAAQLLNDAVVRDGLADQMKRTSPSGRNLRVDAPASQRLRIAYSDARQRNLCHETTQSTGVLRVVIRPYSIDLALLGYQSVLTQECSPVLNRSNGETDHGVRSRRPALGGDSKSDRHAGLDFSCFGVHR